VDLWNMLGLSPVAGMAGAAALLVFAVLFAVRVALRNRGDKRKVGLSLNDGESHARVRSSAPGRIRSS
jgi:hypothetical protein